MARKCAVERSQDDPIVSTTIRIDDEPKTRVAAAAERRGTTEHAFILDAIARQVEQQEQDDELHRLADERWARLLAGGKTVPWAEAKAHLAGRARGPQSGRPAARKPAR